jgi:hypothetical protein
VRNRSYKPNQSYLLLTKHQHGTSSKVTPAGRMNRKDQQDPISTTFRMIRQLVPVGT